MCTENDISPCGELPESAVRVDCKVTANFHRIISATHRATNGAQKATKRNKRRRMTCYPWTLPPDHHPGNGPACTLLHLNEISSFRQRRGQRQRKGRVIIIADHHGIHRSTKQVEHPHAEC
jgi:hypothetical protein